MTHEATSLVRLPRLESPDPLEVGKVIGGMGVESSAYACGMHGPGIEVAVQDAMGSNT